MGGEWNVNDDGVHRVMSAMRVYACKCNVINARGRYTRYQEVVRFR